VTILVSPLLQRLPWIEHGFGTRDAPLSQDGMASLEQIHSASVLIANRPSGCVGEGDALITNLKKVFVSVRTADCFPILLADVRGRVVGAVHAGWRGTAARVAVEAITQMTAHFGTLPRDVHAVIGPGIGKCCYEVGSDVARQFGERAGHLDLATANLRQLIEAGVPEPQIEIVNGCTRCDAGRFYSYSRDGLKAGRMISYIRTV
jgi:YfiH family protein